MYNHYLIESSNWSEDGSKNPTVHGVLYCTADTLVINFIDFLKNHMMYVSEHGCERFDVRYLTESCVNSRLVSVFGELAGKDLTDISVNCPEWETSYRIRRVPELEQSESWSDVVILRVRQTKCKDGDNYDFETTDISVRPANHPIEIPVDDRYEEMTLTINDISIPGQDW